MVTRQVRKTRKTNIIKLGTRSLRDSMVSDFLLVLHPEASQQLWGASHCELFSPSIFSPFPIVFERVTVDPPEIVYHIYIFIFRCLKTYCDSIKLKHLTE